MKKNFLLFILVFMFAGCASMKEKKLSVMDKVRSRAAYDFDCDEDVDDFPEGLQTLSCLSASGFGDMWGPLEVRADKWLDPMGPRGTPHKVPPPPDLAG